MSTLYIRVRLGNAKRSNADQLRYMSMHDNSFIRYFKGHKARSAFPAL